MNLNYALMPDKNESGHDEYIETVGKLNFKVGLGVSVKLVSNLRIEVIGNNNSHILIAPAHYYITVLEFDTGFHWAPK